MPTRVYGAVPPCHDKFTSPQGRTRSKLISSMEMTCTVWRRDKSSIPAPSCLWSIVTRQDTSLARVGRRFQNRVSWRIRWKGQRQSDGKSDKHVSQLGHLRQVLHNATSRWRSHGDSATTTNRHRVNRYRERKRSRTAQTRQPRTAPSSILA